jgi:hypothetical protein
MAMFSIAAPQRLTPAYNPVKYYYASTNSGFAGFKFIFDIYESGTTNRIAEYRVLPNASTFYGEIDLSKLVRETDARLAPPETGLYQNINVK